MKNSILYNYWSSFSNRQYYHYHKQKKENAEGNIYYANTLDISKSSGKRTWPSCSRYPQHDARLNCSAFGRNRGGSEGSELRGRRPRRVVGTIWRGKNDVHWRLSAVVTVNIHVAQYEMWNRVATSLALNTDKKNKKRMSKLKTAEQEYWHRVNISGLFLPAI